MSAQGKAGAEPVRTKVSRQEELLFGPYAAVIRRLGRAVEEVEAAEVEAVELLKGSEEADQLEMGKVAPARGMDDRGRSPHTRAMQALSERMTGVMIMVRDEHREVAASLLERWQSTRHEHGGGGSDEDVVRAAGAIPPVFSGEVMDLPLSELVLDGVGKQLLSPTSSQRLDLTTAGGDTHAKALMVWQTCPSVSRHFNQPFVDDGLEAGQWRAMVPAGAGG